MNDYTYGYTARGLPRGIIAEQSMARPIKPTPAVTGEDAKKLKASLSRVASPEEIARRRAAAKDFLATVMSSKAASNEGGGKRRKP